MSGHARLGITIPLDGPLVGVPDDVRRLRDAGYSDFWTAETAGTDAFTPLAMAAAVPDVQLGTAIASVYTRGPATLAMTAASMAEAAPGRFTLGIGAASPAVVRQWNGIAYDRPLTRVTDVLQILRAALAGERVDLDLETVQVKGFRLENPPDVVPPIVVAALRPGMLEVAGRDGDGAVLNWLSSLDVGRVVPLVQAARTAGGRAASSAAGEAGPTVVARIFVTLSTDEVAVRTAARRLIAGYLTVPGYAAFHRWLGRDELLAPMWTAWAAGDRKAAVSAVPDAVVDDLFVHGSVQSCVAQVRAYAEAGVDIPVLKLLALDGQRDLRADAIAFARAWNG